MRFIFVFLIATFVTIFPAMATQQQGFQTWMQDLRAEALRKGISASIVKLALHDDVKPIPKILELDRKQPENTISFQKYRKSIVSKARVKKGRRMMKEHASELRDVYKSYGVPQKIIVALWGMETNYGGYTGGFSIIEALATLAYDGRRSKYFRKELFQALQILDEGHISPSKMKGSWAGAMGQSQFMPSSFLDYAVDYNNDGKRDIWNTKQDVFASAANYLIQKGWHKEERWGRRVQAPKNISKDLFGLGTEKTLAEWSKKGVKKFNGFVLPSNSDMKGSLVEFTNGTDSEVYLVYHNYRVIMKWNKSKYFATAIGLLADKISN